MKISINPRSDISITSQIVSEIERALVSGGLRPGDQMPTVRALATELRVNFNTVARAYRILDESGIISTQQGRGTFIMEQPPPEEEESLRRKALSTLARRYLEEAQSLGLSPQQALESIRLFIKESEGDVT